MSETQNLKLPDEINEALDKLIKTYSKPEDIMGENGLLKRLTKAVIERALEGEMTHHLGYEKGEVGKRQEGNARNGGKSKTVKSSSGELSIAVPRDRNGTFQPILVPKRQRQIGNFDDLIISLYTRGMTTTEIQEHIQQIYGVEMSIELVSAITNTVMEDVKAWQNRALNAVYPIVYLDALRVKARINGHVQTRVIYLVIGVNLAGTKEMLGLWACESEGAKFWLGMLNDLKNRGVQDILVACVDGLKGFPEAIGTAFPRCDVQLCIVHLIRSSTRQVASKDMKEVAVTSSPFTLPPPLMTLNANWPSSTKSGARNIPWSPAPGARSGPTSFPSSNSRLKSESDLHHQCHRVRQFIHSSHHQQSQSLSQR